MLAHSIWVASSLMVPDNMTVLNGILGIVCCLMDPWAELLHIGGESVCDAHSASLHIFAYSAAPVLRLGWLSGDFRTILPTTQLSVGRTSSCVPRCARYLCHGHLSTIDVDPAATDIKIGWRLVWVRLHAHICPAHACTRTHHHA